MYEIRNKIDLRIAYEILLDVMERNNAKYDDRIIALKRNIRVMHCIRQKWPKGRQNSFYRFRCN